jgi:hypothetical protein
MDRQVPPPPCVSCNIGSVTQILTRLQQWNDPVYGYPGSAAPLTQNSPATQHPMPPGTSSNSQYAYAGHPSNSYSWACYGGAVPPPPGLDLWQRSFPTTNAPPPVIYDSPELTNERKRSFGPSDKIEDLQQQLEDMRIQLERSQKNGQDLAAWIRRELKRSEDRQDELEDFLSRLTRNDGSDSRSPATNPKSRHENTMGWAQQGTDKTRGQPGSNSLQGPHDHNQQKGRQSNGKPNSHKRKVAQPKRRTDQHEGTPTPIKTEDAKESGTAAEAQSQDNVPRAPAQVIPPLVRPTHQKRF